MPGESTSLLGGREKLKALEQSSTARSTSPLTPVPSERDEIEDSFNRFSFTSAKTTLTDNSEETVTPATLR